jgi:hypothetical protein
MVKSPAKFSRPRRMTISAPVAEPQPDQRLGQVKFA